MRTDRTTAALSLAAFFTLHAAAQQAAAPQREAPDDPPAPLAEPLPRGPAAVPASPGFESVQVNVDENGDNILFDAANEPSIAADPTAPNRMVIGWRQFNSIQSNFRQAGYAWTNDGGRSWHAGVIEPGLFRSDPVIEALSTGEFLYLSLEGASNFHCQVFHSADGGQTWPVKTEAFGGDKMWFTADKTGGPSDGHVYGSWSTCCGDWAATIATRSINGAESFQNPVSVPNSPVWGTLAVGPAGELYLAGRTGTSFRVARSLNAADPGATPTFDTTTVEMGGPMTWFEGPNPGGLVGQIWVDVDRSGGPHHGNVYLLAPVNPAGPDPLDAMFARSTDGGQTWSDPVEVTGEAPGANAWQWFGTMSVAPNGRIDVVWNDTLTDQSDWSELRYTYSWDAGETWADPVALSPQWNSKIGWPNQNKIGDYYDMESDLVGANLAWAATFTGGQDVYYLRIGDYDCNQNGVGDTDDLAMGLAQDCNNNGIPDSCEIAAGAVQDADNNGVPDDCEACYADFDQSGALNLFDFLAYTNAFNAGDPAADCDASGALNLFDFLCFTNAFNAGC